MVQMFINLKGETNILYRLITCKVRYFKPLFDIIVMIMAYRYEKLFFTNLEFGVFISVSHNHHNYNKIKS